MYPVLITYACINNLCMYYQCITMQVLSVVPTWLTKPTVQFLIVSLHTITTLCNLINFFLHTVHASSSEEMIPLTMIILVVLSVMVVLIVVTVIVILILVCFIILKKGMNLLIVLLLILMTWSSRLTYNYALTVIEHVQQLSVTERRGQCL